MNTDDAAELARLRTVEEKYMEYVQNWRTRAEQIERERDDWKQHALALEREVCTWKKRYNEIASMIEGASK